MAIGTGEGLLGAQQAARVPFEVHTARWAGRFKGIEGEIYRF
jgi:hypothetical protein